MIDHPPYFAGRNDPVDTGSIGHFPIAYQRGAAQDAMFDPRGGANTPIGRLLVEMNQYLNLLRDREAYAGDLPAGAVPPDVMFGCPSLGSGHDCLERDDSLAGGGSNLMRLAVGRPSNRWIEWAAGLNDRDSVALSLVLTLELGQYFLREEGAGDRKIVELGTGYTVSFSWFTSVDAPVEVLQLTGALMGADGRAIRIGAEGMLARRTNLLLSSIGAQNQITDEEIEKLRAQRREDLPGQPLVWEVAMRNLVLALTRGD